jgi:hypothetical protein
MLLSDFLSPEKSGDVSDAVIALVRLAANPKAAEQRVLELRAATEKAREALEAAQAAQESLKAAKADQDAVITAERAAHDDKLSRERRAWDGERSQRDAEIRRREAETNSQLLKAKADAEAAEKIRTELAERLENVKRAAAA